MKEEEMLAILGISLVVVVYDDIHENNLAMSDKLDPDLLIPMITTDDTFIVGSVGNLQCVVSTNYTDASYTVDWIRRDTR